MTNIINLFLEKRAVKEIEAIVFVRQLSFIIKIFNKIMDPSLFEAIKNLMCHEKLLEIFFATLALPDVLKEQISKLLFKEILNMEDLLPFLELIWERRDTLRLLIAQYPEDSETKRMAKQLCKMVRIHKDVRFIANRIKSHQNDKSLTMLSRPFYFVENTWNCHPEIAMLKAAIDHSNSDTLTIGVSKRPCFCCSILFNSVEYFKCIKFKISIVSTNGKLYNNWNIIDDDSFLFLAIRFVWLIVVQQISKVENSQVDDYEGEDACESSIISPKDVDSE